VEPDRIKEFIAEYVGDCSPYLEWWWEVYELEQQQIADQYVDILGVRIRRDAGADMSIDDIVASEQYTAPRFPTPRPGVIITEEMREYASSYNPIGAHDRITGLSAGARVQRDLDGTIRSPEFTEYSFVSAPADQPQSRTYSEIRSLDGQLVEMVPGRIIPNESQ
jgi:hypothetical protein